MFSSPTDNTASLHCSLQTFCAPKFLLPCDFEDHGAVGRGSYAHRMSCCSGCCGVWQLWLASLTSFFGQIQVGETVKFTHQKVFASPEALVMGILRRC